MSQVLAGKFQLHRLLGKGGMGEVYEATELATGRRVAVKRLHGDPSKGGRLLREARAVAAVRSPYIVDVVDAGVDPTTGDPYLAMEYLEGTDLSKLLPKGTALPPEVALKVALHVSRGLEKAHTLGIVHRDIKPANIFLIAHDADSYRVKIVDFGLARTIVHDGGEVGDEALTQLTRTDTIIGSPAYMAPEQVRGLKTLDQRCDLWSLGVLMYRMLSGRLPHPRTDAGIGDMLVAICSDPAPPLQRFAPHVPDAVCAVVHKALSIDPAQRFQTAQEVSAALEQLVKGDRIPANLIVGLPLAKPQQKNAAEESGERSTVSMAHTGNTTDPIGRNPVFSIADDMPLVVEPPAWPTTRTLTHETSSNRGRYYAGIAGAVALLVITGGVLAMAAQRSQEPVLTATPPPMAEPVSRQTAPAPQPTPPPPPLPPLAESAAAPAAALAAPTPSAAPSSKPAPRRDRPRPSPRPSDPFARKFE